jgi:hypothetical protein
VGLIILKLEAPVAKPRTVKNQIDLLARLIEDANRSAPDAGKSPFGKCVWTDIEGQERCNSPWSQFQCEQAEGVFTPDASCDD